MEPGELGGWDGACGCGFGVEVVLLVLVGVVMG
jgi:hypothetical protein